MPGACATGCSIAYCRLYRHAHGTTLVACIAGFLGALANSPVHPTFVLLFGQVRHQLCIVTAVQASTW